jgi:hypothetical protein
VNETLDRLTEAFVDLGEVSIGKHSQRPSTEKRLVARDVCQDPLATLLRSQFVKACQRERGGIVHVPLRRPSVRVALLAKERNYVVAS